MENNHHVQAALKLLEGVSKGVKGRELDSIILQGIQVVEARGGFLRCNFVVPVRLADKDGNWEVGAIATLIDAMGTLVMYSFSGHVNVTADFNVSFLSTAKIQEEVLIEAELIGEREKLASVRVEVRRKNNGQLIAVGKQWMVSINVKAPHLISKL